MTDVLNPLTADERDSSIDRPRAYHCPRCGAEPSEVHRLPCGCVELFCEACCEPPRYYGWFVPSAGCRQNVGAL